MEHRSPSRYLLLKFYIHFSAGAESVNTTDGRVKNNTQVRKKSMALGQKCQERGRPKLPTLSRVRTRKKMVNAQETSSHATGAPWYS